MGSGWIIIVYRLIKTVVVDVVFSEGEPKKFVYCSGFWKSSV